MASLRGKSVVITGASSGIGRSAALAFAREGAKLTLAARRVKLLDDLAAECKSHGAQAIVVATDVTDAEAVGSLAQAAKKQFGRIDVWINNAGAGTFGPYQNASLDLHRRTIETNLFGSMHGAYAVLPVFLQQGEGILINNVSMCGWLPTPYAAAYTASKFGLRGFGASLRQELKPHRNIHVCSVFPALIDTPGINNAANVSGRTLNPGPFYYTPEDVAETFVSLAKHPRSEAAVGWPSRAAELSYGLAPLITENLVGLVLRWALSRAAPGPNSEGNLLAPHSYMGTARGGWLARKHMPPAGYLSGAGAVLGLLAAGLVLAAASGGGRRS